MFVGLVILAAAAAGTVAYRRWAAPPLEFGQAVRAYADSPGSARDANSIGVMEAGPAGDEAFLIPVGTRLIVVDPSVDHEAGVAVRVMVDEGPDRGKVGLVGLECVRPIR